MNFVLPELLDVQGAREVADPEVSYNFVHSFQVVGNSKVYLALKTVMLHLKGFIHFLF